MEGASSSINFETFIKILDNRNYMILLLLNVRCPRSRTQTSCIGQVHIKTVQSIYSFKYYRKPLSFAEVSFRRSKRLVINSKQLVPTILYHENSTGRLMTWLIGNRVNSRPPNNPNIFYHPSILLSLEV